MEHASWTASLPFRSPTRRHVGAINFEPPATTVSATTVPAAPPPRIVSLPPEQSTEHRNKNSDTSQVGANAAGDNLPTLRTPPNQQSVESSTTLLHPQSRSCVISANDLSNLQLASPLIIQRDDVFSPMPTEAMDTSKQADTPGTDSPPRSITHVKDIDFSPRASSTPGEEARGSSIKHIKDIDFSPTTNSPDPSTTTLVKLSPDQPYTPTHPLKRLQSLQSRCGVTLPNTTSPPLSSNLRVPKIPTHAASRTAESSDSDSDILHIKTPPNPNPKNGKPRAVTLPFLTDPSTHNTPSNLALAPCSHESRVRITRTFSAWDLASHQGPGSGRTQFHYRTGARERLLGICVKAPRNKREKCAKLKAAPSTVLCERHEVYFGSEYTRPLGEMLREVLRAGVGGEGGGLEGVESREGLGGDGGGRLVGDMDDERRALMRSGMRG
ncbi:hypothetical protein MBLNU230_g5074t1 [Neophaeotheca triangularis]